MKYFIFLVISIFSVIAQAEVQLAEHADKFAGKTSYLAAISQDKNMLVYRCEESGKDSIQIMGTEWIGSQGQFKANFDGVIDKKIYIPDATAKQLMSFDDSKSYDSKERLVINLAKSKNAVFRMYDYRFRVVGDYEFNLTGLADGMRTQAAKGGCTLPF